MYAVVSVDSGAAMDVQIGIWWSYDSCNLVDSVMNVC
jgi:hypothetical protein